MKSLSTFKLKDMELKNRIIMPPMCMYSADEDGMVKDFHINHYVTRAVGGVGLIILEATAVTPNGRISSNDLGIWSDDHINGLKNIVDKSKVYGAKMGIQLAHAGRKCESNDEFIVAPSPIEFSDEYRIPMELDNDGIKEIVGQFKDAAKRADAAGFHMIEIHGAHGYLINEFLSPLANKRSDEYGGSRENRVRFLKEIIAAIKEVWPNNKPIGLRVSADDYTEGGIDKEEIVEIVNLVKDDIDMVHVSSGGVVRARINAFPGYQVTHAETIKSECHIPTIAVGLIEDYDHIEEIISNGRADLVALGRALLRNPYLVLNMAYKNGIKDFSPIQYERGFF
ncbi:NADPH dehydrogenase NamA [Tissierella sp. Yu-01]|uniref:NADPH dehydrogenase NamA n=1 Tax=Tissierella sp. Yu-01 TaxID=3035694 RepID=UPI00240E386A|nr:NADPH dehydrogenase NamA [Tissierella sp. Yu-01]WFA08104.1 NADPH dehydrogenase NamA [Tissierella sp. Yu-01]